MSPKPTHDSTILPRVRLAVLAARSFTSPSYAPNSDGTWLLAGTVKSESSCKRNHKVEMTRHKTTVTTRELLRKASKSGR